MYEMVQNAYKVTLVGAFVPLACGIYWHRATTQGALVSALCGLAVWVIGERFFADADIPPQMWGLFASIVGMLVGSFRGPSWSGTRATRPSPGADPGGRETAYPPSRGVSPLLFRIFVAFRFRPPRASLIWRQVERTRRVPSRRRRATMSKVEKLDLMGVTSLAAVAAALLVGWMVTTHGAVASRRAAPRPEKSSPCRTMAA